MVQRRLVILSAGQQFSSDRFVAGDGSDFPTGFLNEDSILTATYAQ